MEVYKITNIIGQNIKTKRKKQGKTLADISAKTPFSSNHIGQIERGQSKANLFSILTIAGTLNLSMEQVFEGAININKTQLHLELLDQLDAKKEEIKTLKENIKTDHGPFWRHKYKKLVTFFLKSSNEISELQRKTYIEARKEYELIENDETHK